MNRIEAENKANKILELMTLDEKIELVGGEDIFFIKGIPRLNIPKVLMSDATQGIRIVKEFEYQDKVFDLSEFAMEKSTAFPSPICLAATWNVDLAYQYANSIGEECKAGGIGILLGPGMNIYRNSQCGRNFEYFGEDPFLAAKIVENYVKGVQSTGTVATLKHFVANNTDFFRRKSNSVIDERTLHEIYMPAFKAGINAGAKAVMTAYNLLNGEYCGESNYVINYLLRNKLEFDGLVMTDWWSVHDGEKLATSGQDLEMPYTIALSDVNDLLANQKIYEKDINRMVKSILVNCYEMDLYERKPDQEYYKTFNSHVDVVLNTAREGIVLLKNNGILPLKTDIKNILITGEFVKEMLRGGGSAAVEGYDNITLLEALKQELGDKINLVENPSIDEITNAELVICNIGTMDSEGADRPFELPEEQETKVKLCVVNNPNTIVIVSSGSGIKMTNWNDKAAAIIYSWYLGQTGNVALAEIISGKITPSGKLPMTIEKDFKDSPAYGYMQGEDFYVGWNDEGEQAHEIYDVKYKEGIFVGYRWFEKKKIEPLYHFGFGLSYTEFDIKLVRISPEKFKIDDKIIIELEIKNIGKYFGSEVIQVYIEDLNASFERPLKELKAFSKVLLNKNETKSVKLELNKETFSFWSPTIKGWIAEKGKFNLHIGTAYNQIKFKKKIELI